MRDVSFYHNDNSITLLDMLMCIIILVLLKINL